MQQFCKRGVSNPCQTCGPKASSPTRGWAVGRKATSVAFKPSLSSYSACSLSTTLGLYFVDLTSPMLLLKEVVSPEDLMISSLAQMVV